MYHRARILYKDGSLVVETPYSAEYVAAIKAVIPSKYRRYDAIYKTWHCHPDTIRAVYYVVSLYFHNVEVDNQIDVSRACPIDYQKTYADFLERHHKRHNNDTWADVNKDRNQEASDRKRNRRQKEYDDRKQSREKREHDEREQRNDERRTRNKDYYEQRSRRSYGAGTTQGSSDYSLLFVSTNAPMHVITAAWKALNKEHRKKDELGSSALKEINAAYDRLNK